MKENKRKKEHWVNRFLPADQICLLIRLMGRQKALNLAEMSALFAAAVCLSLVVCICPTPLLQARLLVRLGGRRRVGRMQDANEGKNNAFSRHPRFTVGCYRNRSNP